MADDDTTVLSSVFVPHPDALDEVFGASIDRLRTLGDFFSIVNSPAHGLHDKRSRVRVFRVQVCRRRAPCSVLSDDWSIGVGSYVVARLFLSNVN